MYMSNKEAHKQLIQLLDIKIKLSSGYSLPKIGIMPILSLEPNNWQKAASIAAKLNYRFVSMWAQDLNNIFELNIVLELHNSYLLLRALIDNNAPTIASFTPYFLAANLLERHTHDMFGINFSNHPDNRRWTRHLAWGADQFPLRKNFPVESLMTTPTPPDSNYPFTQIIGSGVCEVPVGPVHAGIIEPGHFRFQITGEDILKLEIRLGYTHKGIEKIAEGREVNSLIKLAGRVSGDSTAAHAWAACAALENAINLEIPNRALYIRAIICERERIANHLGDFASVCNDVAYTFAYYQLMRLKELWLRINAQIFGHRFMMDCITLGGVTTDLNSENCQALHKQISDFKLELDELIVIFEAHFGLHNRIKTTGILTAEQAASLGVLGYVGRASGHKFDLRHDVAYPPYDKFKIHVPVFNTGDVLARLRVRFQEILVALDLIDQLLNTLPSGAIHTPWVAPNKVVEGIGLIEGWRGEIITFVRLGDDNLVERYFPRDPSWFSWQALEQLIQNNIVPEFPVCNKSINGSYSGVDL
ncbi:MAG TPA: Ni,Fe-hydrogenase III large subunit [Coxiellaceae bacterium]|nr:Ni,Fe-hydrogenase III large subunit [Coxiellaceae bacterium]